MSSSSGPGPLGTAFRQELLLFFCLSLLSSCCHSVLLLADHQQTIRFRLKIKQVFYKLQFSHSLFAVKKWGICILGLCIPCWCLHPSLHLNAFTPLLGGIYYIFGILYPMPVPPSLPALECLYPFVGGYIFGIMYPMPVPPSLPALECLYPFVGCFL